MPRKKKKRRKKINVAKAVVQETEKQKRMRWKAALIKSAGREDLSRSGKELPAAKDAKKEADRLYGFSRNSVFLKGEEKDRKRVKAAGEKLRTLEASHAKAKDWIQLGGGAKEGAEQQLARTKKTTGEAETQLSMKEYAKKKRKDAKKKRKAAKKAAAKKAAAPKKAAPKKKKVLKKSIQRTVAEAPSTPKRLRSEAIAGETMKLHPKIEKADQKATAAAAKSYKRDLGATSGKAYEKYEKARDKENTLRFEAMSLVRRRENPSSTVGKAGKEMETRRRKKSKKED